MYAGLQIYDYMKASKAPIHTVCEGSCMSMGAYLLSWGTIRESNPNATIMLHQVGGGIQGRLNEMLAEVKECIRLQNIVNHITEEHTGLDHNTLLLLENYDDFMSPEQARHYNLIDTITKE